MTVFDPNRARLVSVAPRIRETKDVDCVVHALTRAEYDTRVRDMLRAKGFVEMNEPGVPVCAWTRNGLRLDVMPLDDSVLGFSNSWYRYAWEHPLEFELGDVFIRIVSAPVFIATKLEAFNNRGDGDYRASHDLEDIIAVIDGREELLQEMEQAPSDVQTFVRSEMGRLLHDPDFLDALPGHVLDPGRVPIVVKRIRTY